MSMYSLKKVTLHFNNILKMLRGAKSLITFTQVLYFNVEVLVLYMSSLYSMSRSTPFRFKSI